jgi:hypothetical protein
MKKFINELSSTFLQVTLATHAFILIFIAVGVWFLDRETMKLAIQTTDGFGFLVALIGVPAVFSVPFTFAKMLVK